MGRDTFIKGAVVLALGSLVSRGLGAVYRFFLPLLFGGGQQAQVGIGLFNMAYPIYTVLLGVSATGIPSAVAKLVAEHVARGNAAGARATFRLSLWMLTVMGLILTLGLWWSAGYLATHVARDERAALSIQAVAPAVFLVSVMSVYRGYFQGLQRMTPHALSQVMEQIVRIGTMFLFAWLLLPKGIEWAAAGATFGAVTGAVAGLGYLMVVYARHRHAADNPLAESGARASGASEPAPAGEMMREILSLAIPISLVGVILPLMGMIDTAVVPARLHAAGFGRDEATSLYGVLTGYATPFVIAPTVFTAALAMSLLPSVAQANASGNLASLRSKVMMGNRATILIVLPATMGLVALAREIPATFFDAPEAGLPLALLAIGGVFLGLEQTSSAVLQGLGLSSIPMRNLLAGAAVKLTVTWVLTAIPGVNIAGAAIGTSLSFLASAWLNQRALDARLGGRTDWASPGGKALLASLVMALAARGTFLLLQGVLGLKLATLAGVAAGGLAYPAALLAIGGVTSGDLALIPGLGPRLSALLIRLRILRS